MKSYRITWWHEAGKGQKKEKSREIIAAANAESALRAYFGNAGGKVKIDYDKGRDEAVSYGIPALKTSGLTARQEAVLLGQQNRDGKKAER